MLLTDSLSTLSDESRSSRTFSPHLRFAAHTKRIPCGSIVAFIP